MSSGTGARHARAVLMVACVLIVGLLAALPASAVEGRNRDKQKGETQTQRRGLYVLKKGPCDLGKLPKAAIRQWTPAGESIVHMVSYGQGLQLIAQKYGFKGDEAYRVLYDANPQLEQLHLERSGITLRIPVCQARMYRRKLPEPPPPPKPEKKKQQDSAQPSDDGPSDAGSGGGDGSKDDAPSVPNDSVWDQLAECEAGGDWSANTGNGYYGGLQFSESSWLAVGGTGLPHEHSREEQIKRGKLLQDEQGWGAWPHCAAELGLI
jgi:hypothetical protein